MPSTRERVPDNTSEAVNRRIQREIEASVRYFAQNRAEIPKRLRELDEEWDIERAIEANAGAAGFAGLALAFLSDRRWLVVPTLVTGFLLQHAVEGWCPPVPVFRRLGFRTSHEIEQERQALKALRGDYGKVDEAKDSAAAALKAAQA
jgi:hypothetical protein